MKLTEIVALVALSTSWIVAARLGKVHVLHLCGLPQSFGGCSVSGGQSMERSTIVVVKRQQILGSSPYIKRAPPTSEMQLTLSLLHLLQTLLFLLHFPFSLSLSSLTLFYYYNISGFYLGITLLKRNLLVLILKNYGKVHVVF